MSLEHVEHLAELRDATDLKLRATTVGQYQSQRKR
jgi:hypothetical protein